MSVFRRLLRRTLASAGVAALGLSVVAVTAVPGHADEPLVDLSVSVHSSTASLDSTAKSVRIVVGNDISADATATNVTLRFKLPAGNDAGSVRVSDELAPSCELSADGRGGSCAIGTLDAGALLNLNAFTILPTPDNPGAVIGVGQLEVVSDQTDRDVNDNSGLFHAGIAAKGGTDLATWAKRDLAVLPGESSVIDDSVVELSNESDVAVDGVSLFMVLPRELSFTTVPDGCTVDNSTGINYVDCMWPDITIAGQDRLALSGSLGFGFKVADDAPADTRLSSEAFVAAWALNEDAEQELVIGSNRPAESGMTAFSSESAEPDETLEDNWAEFAVFTHGDSADLSLSANDLVAPINNTTELHLTVSNHGPGATGSHQVEAYVPGYAQLGDLPETCYVKGADPTRILCDSAGILNAGGSVVYTIPVTMVEVPAEAEEGRALVSGSQPDPDMLNNFDIYAVTSIENRADLELSVDDVNGFPGDTVDLAFAVTNHGPADAQNHQVLLTLPSYTEVAELPDTCKDLGANTIWCAVPTALDAGNTATFTLAVTILDAPEEQEAGLASVGTQANPDPNMDNNTVSFLVSATENRADLSIAAGELTGKVNDEVSGSITVTNNGPAAVAAYHVLFTLPVHAELVEIPAGCELVSDDFTAILCGVGEPLPAGESRDIGFTVTLVDAPEEQLPGDAAVLSTQPDPDETNNSAEFTVHAQTEPEEPGKPGDDDDANGKLPTTGVSLTTAAGGAGLVAALGLAALMVTRRRRRAATYGNQ